MNQPINAVITTVPAASTLRRVEGFNPLKFLRKVKSERTGSEVLKLELPYQKLWFRLAYPNGRMLLNNLRLTDQLAIFEAIVFSDKNDGNPLSRITASATPSDTPNGKYIEAAQDKALSEALENAGFGIQLCDIAESAGRSDYGSVVSVAPPQETRDNPPSTIASSTTAPQTQSTVPTAQQEPATAPAPQTQNTAPPVQQEQADTPAPVAEVATAQSVEQPQTVMPPAQVAAPTEGAMQTADTSVSNTPTAAPEVEAVANPVTNPANAAPTVEPAAPVAETATSVAEPTAPAAPPVSAPMQEQAETPAAKAEGTPTRLPTSLELLRASTQAQIVMFPESNTAPSQDAAPEQPAPDDNGGETPMNTAQAAGNYTADMTVEEISAKMSLDEARAVVVNEGLCKGWTLGQVAESRPASLRFYVHSNRSDNVLKAAARLVMDGSALKQAG